MGKVYAATDGALGRRVAVKVIRDEWVVSDAAVRRFRREARAVAGFAHPNVVTVYDYGVEAGAPPFLVMELLEGATLRDEIARSTRLGPARTLEVLPGVCSAVDAARRRQLVHRDLKPENIFLTDGGAVKILDFGVAKLLSPGDDVPGSQSTFETETGVLVGTVGYMSPEQLLGECPAVSWDLWTLTVVAYETVTGTLPFPVSSREAWRQSAPTSRPAS
jgi:serine/threonine-protein kinase